MGAGGSYLLQAPTASTKSKESPSKALRAKRCRAFSFEKTCFVFSLKKILRSFFCRSNLLGTRGFRWIGISSTSSQGEGESPQVSNLKTVLAVDCRRCGGITDNARSKVAMQGFVANFLLQTIAA